MKMILRAENLQKAYKKRLVVRDVSFEVAPGEVVGLLGPNGAGKTTTFYMIVGLIKPNSGRVYLGEQEITRLPMYRRARSGIGYLPQESSVFRQLTIEQNLHLVLEMNQVPVKTRREQVEKLLQEFHIAHIRSQRGHVLSGGERRRVEIARALALKPAFMLLDEPFTGIDPRTIEELQGIILQLRERGIGILITDHNVSATLRITDRSYILADGHIVAQGTPEEVLSDSLARKYYFGESFEL
jgi:lipopolysaccharide export system ATP-binding protein